MRIVLGLILALVLMIIPMPETLEAFRPPWVLLYILCVVLYSPQYYRLGWVILLGLLVDAMLYSVLGQHGLSYVVATWLAASQARRFHWLSQEHQLMWIAVFCFVNEFILYVMNGTLGFGQVFLTVILKSILGVMCWPVLKRFYTYSSSHAMINKLSMGVTYEL